PVWVYEAPRGFYHDFHASYRSIEPLSRLAQAHPSGFTLGEAARAGVDREAVEGWYKDGYVVPVG
ncbi:MAG: hypothetical protein IT326_00525, partial [Anaerolineae bacterium]|nr:hypothetical protein [Anaerolineae bacterium]